MNKTLGIYKTRSIGETCFYRGNVFFTNDLKSKFQSFTATLGVYDRAASREDLPEDYIKEMICPWEFLE